MVKMAPVESTIRTSDGQCRCYVFTAAGTGPSPGVIMLMDGFGLRDTLFAMAQRLADGGYVVLLPDLFYRAGPYPQIDVRRAFASGDALAFVRDALGRKDTEGRPTDAALVAADMPFFINHLRSRDDVAAGKIGIVGYCFTGSMALAAAALHPDSIAAAASFHAGDLATASELSPDRLAQSIKARLYVASADNDPFCPPEMIARLEAALAAAGVDYRSEIYTGARHGWNMSDTPFYDPEACERHWHELFALYGGTLLRLDKVAAT